MNDVWPLLKTLGIKPEQITEEKISKIKDMNLDYTNSNSFTSDNCQKMMDILGIQLNKPEKKEKKEKKIKVPRNSICGCGSGKKYKFCCINN